MNLHCYEDVDSQLEQLSVNARISMITSSLGSPDLETGEISYGTRDSRETYPLKEFIALAYFTPT